MIVARSTAPVGQTNAQAPQAWHCSVCSLEGGADLARLAAAEEVDRPAAHHLVAHPGAQAAEDALPLGGRLEGRGRRRPAPRRTSASSRESGAWARSSSRTTRRASLHALGFRCGPSGCSSTGWLHEATSCPPRGVSISTRHTRQRRRAAGRGSCRAWGSLTPICRAASRIVVPRGTSAVRPSTLTRTRSDADCVHRQSFRPKDSPIFVGRKLGQSPGRRIDGDSPGLVGRNWRQSPRNWRTVPGTKHWGSPRRHVRFGVRTRRGNGPGWSAPRRGPCRPCRTRRRSGWSWPAAPGGQVGGGAPGLRRCGPGCGTSAWCPSRQGTHLPHDSSRKKPTRNRAMSTMQALSSSTMIPPVPIMIVSPGRSSRVDGQVEHRGRDAAARRPRRPGGPSAAGRPARPPPIS